MKIVFEIGGLVMEDDWRITLSCIESSDSSFIGYQKSYVNSPITIGRAENNDLIVSDPSASRNHAVLRITSDYSRVFITDMSSHGTDVSGKPVPKGRGSGFTLENGDTIKIGQTVLQYEIQLKSSVQSTMIGQINRDFLDKPPEQAPPEEEPAAPEPVIKIVDETKKSNPVFIAVSVVLLIILIYLIISS